MEIARAKGSQATQEYSYYYEEKTAYDVIKRLIDIVCALTALVVLSPLMLLATIAIKLEDGGPAIFAQIRLTKGGKEFKMYKFRSMCVDAEQKQHELHKHNIMDGPVFKMKGDPRITRVGKVIRATSIDELPQLVNVLLGDMSVIGPRPPLPKEAAVYTPYQMHRLDVKTGLSCYWQCSGRNEIGFEEWVELDLKYIMERSLWTDLKITLKTIADLLHTLVGKKLAH